MKIKTTKIKSTNIDHFGKIEKQFHVQYNNYSLDLNPLDYWTLCCYCQSKITKQNIPEWNKLSWYPVGIKETKKKKRLSHLKSKLIKTKIIAIKKK